MKVTKPVPKYRTYTLEDGWQIFVGKTDEDNDLVSFQLATPKDYWFHISTLPGSHTLLRAPEGVTTPPDKAHIQAAAAVAAYFSKGRNAGLCTVDYCLACHVSKPRGAKAGSVNITDFKRIKVQPKLPVEETPSPAQS